MNMTNKLYRSTIAREVSRICSIHGIILTSVKLNWYLKWAKAFISFIPLYYLASMSVYEPRGFNMDKYGTYVHRVLRH